MSNIFVNVGKGIGTVAIDLEKGIARIFTVIDKTEKVLVTVVENESSFKTVLISECTQAVSLASEIASVLAEKGLNLEDDLDLLTKVKAFFTGVTTTFIPAVETIYGQIEADVTSPATTPAV